MRWSPSGRQLASGGNDNLVCIWDAASASSSSPAAPLQRLTEHTAAVKALAWCPFQVHYSSPYTITIMSGSSATCSLRSVTHNNFLLIIILYDWQSNLLATGGGSADGYIRFWNVNTGSCLNRLQTGSQVSATSCMISEDRTVH